MRGFSAFVTAAQKIGIHPGSVYPQYDKRLIRISEKSSSERKLKFGGSLLLRLHYLIKKN